MISKSTIKYIQSLQLKKNRDEHNAFIAEGPKVVNELLLQGTFDCEAVYCTNAWLVSNAETLTGIEKNRIFAIEGFELEKISALSIANQVLAVFYKKPLITNVDFENKLTIILEDIQDPGNLGTIIRTADWFGIENIICSLATADCYNSKVVQSTMASLGRVNIFYNNILPFLQGYINIKKYAALLSGKNVKSFGKINEGFILMGNESKGLSNELVAITNEKITIEKIGQAESLNVAIATSIILHSIS